MKGIILNSEQVNTILDKGVLEYKKAIKLNNFIKHYCVKHHNYLESTGAVCYKGVETKAQINPYFASNGLLKQEFTKFSYLRCPFGKVGDNLFVKEVWSLVQECTDYESGGEWNCFEWEYSLKEAKSVLGDCIRGSFSSAVYYPADGEDKNPSEMFDCVGLNHEILQKKEISWRPAYKMPQWASRLTVEITDIKVEKADVWEWVVNLKLIK